MAKKKITKKEKVKVLAILNSWEKKDSAFWFTLGQKYPKAHIKEDKGFGFGYIVFDASSANPDGTLFNNALLLFLKDNPQYNEGQDVTPDDEAFDALDHVDDDFDWNGWDDEGYNDDDEF